MLQVVEMEDSEAGFPMLLLEVEVADRKCLVLFALAVRSVNRTQNLELEVLIPFALLLLMVLELELFIRATIFGHRFQDHLDFLSVVTILI